MKGKSILKHATVAVLALVVWQVYDKNWSKPSAKPRVEGYFHPAFRKVAETFRANVESGLEKGASFAVYHKGELLVDLWGGWADIEAERHWQENTLCMTWSIAKAAAAIAVALLVDKGQLDYKEKVSHYWPEFASNNKEDITVESLLSHTAGLIFLNESFSLLEYKYNWPKIEKMLASQSPQWNPGTAVGYHGITYGMYVDALVRKTDPQHRNLSQFFQEEIASVLDIEYYIGLPPHLFHRFARIHKTSFWEARIDLLAGFSSLFNPYFHPVVYSWDIHTKFERLNNPDLLSVGLPSAIGAATARSVAKMFDFVANNGSVGHQKLLSFSAVAGFLKPPVRGLPNLFFAENAFVRGMILRSAEGHQHVGHSGLLGNYGWGDTTIGAGFAYLTNHLTMYAQDDPRQVSLRQAFLECFVKYKDSLKKKNG
ncbi:hypothetical protein EGW08_014085, partial [Elysia chlorotica]